MSETYIEADGSVVLDKSTKLVKYSPVCTLCKHLDIGPFLEAGAHRCEAFARIPDEIWQGDNDHTEPYEGDGGVRFEGRAVANG